MKTYNIYRHPVSRKYEVVKIGWSWPGFLFAPFWAFVKKLWLVASISSCYLFIMYFLPVSELITSLLSFAPYIYAGIQGNELRRLNLEARGYQRIASAIKAQTDEGALAKMSPEETGI